MRKFLSILLAVMMVLSTVSFAAPSAIGSVQTADDFVAVENTPAEEAELSGTVAVDDAKYGKMIFDMDFTDKSDVSFASGTLASDVAGYYTDDASFAGIKVYTSCINKALDVEENGNVRAVSNNQWPVMGVSSLNGKPEGYYTFVSDFTHTNTSTLPLAFRALGSDPYDKKDGTDIAVLGVVASEINKGYSVSDYSSSYLPANTTVTGAVTVDNALTQYASLYCGGPNSSFIAYFDNAKLYYRPKTVDVTFELDGVTKTVEDVSTLSAAKLSTLFESLDFDIHGSKTATGFVANGNTYNVDASVNLLEDITFAVTIGDDPYADFEKGKLLVGLDFNAAEAKEIGTGGKYGLYGNKINNIGSNINGEMQGTGTKAIRIEDGNGYFVFNNAGSTDYFSVYEYVSGSNAYHDFAGKGVYTLEFKVRYKNAAEGALALSVKAEESGKGTGHSYTMSGFSATANDTTWKQYSVSFDTTDWTKNSFGRIFIYPGAGNEEVHIDDFKLYYKPSTVDVTFVYNGKEYVAEGVSTAGFDVKTAVSQAGIILSTGKMAVASLTEGGETKNSFVFAYDTTLYVSTIDDPGFDANFGTRVINMTFDEDTLPETVSLTTVAGLTTDYAEGFGNLTVQKQHMKYVEGSGYLQNQTIEDDGLKQGPYPGFGIMDLNKVAQKGYYTFVADITPKTTMNLNFCGGSSINAKTGVVSDLIKNANGNWVDIGASGHQKQGISSNGTFAVVVDTTDGGVSAHFYIGAHHTLDNAKLYYKPKTATVLLTTEEDGVADVTVKDVSTLGVRVSDLIANIDARRTDKNIIGVVFGGKTYTLADTIILGGNAEMEVLFGQLADDNAQYGHLIAKAGFDNAVVGYYPADNKNWPGQAIKWISLGEADAVSGSKMSSSLGLTYDLSSINTYVYNTYEEADGQYMTATSIGTGSNVSLYAATGSKYNSMTDPNVVYTFVADLKADANADNAFVRAYMADGAGGRDRTPESYVESAKFAISEDWNTYAVSVDTNAAIKDWTYGAAVLALYIPAKSGATALVDIDNWAWYYKPATVEVTFEDEEGNVVAVETISSANPLTVASATELLVGSSPFKAVTSFTYAGTTYTGDDKLYLSKDAIIEVTIGENEIYSQSKGDLLFNFNFDNADTLTAGQHGSPATDYGYWYNENYANAGQMRWYTPAAVNGAELVTEENGNKYVSMVNGTQHAFFAMTYTGKNAGGNASYIVPAGIGVYTIEMDVKHLGTKDGSTTSNAVYVDPRIHGNQNVIVSSRMPLDLDATGWKTYSHQALFTQEKYDYWNVQEGANHVQFYFNIQTNSAPYGTEELAVDNLRVWFKPFTATLTGTLGENEFEATGISTTDATVASIVNEFNELSTRLAVTGFKYAGVTYDATEHAETVVSFPGDATIELVGTMSELDPNAPVTENTASVYTGEAYGTGIRFKASFSNTLEPTAYGWAITREALLLAEEFTVETAVEALEGGIDIFVQGWNYDPEGTYAEDGPVEEAIVYENDGIITYFTAVLYGIDYENYPERTLDKLVAVPITEVGGELYCGTPVAATIYEVAKKAAEAGDTSDKVTNIITIAEEYLASIAE